MKRISVLFLTVCTLFSLFLGGTLSDLQKGAQSMIGALSPLPCNVTYTDASTGEQVVRRAVSVRFFSDTAYLSSGEQLPADSAQFTYLDENALDRRSARSGAAAVGFSLLTLNLLLAMTSFCVRLSCVKRRRARTAKVHRTVISARHPQMLQRKIAA